MEVKEIFKVLSEDENAISYTSFLFETSAEKKSLSHAINIKALKADQAFF